MGERTCDVIPPNYMHDMDGATACPLPFNHDGPHQTTTPRWGPIVWADDETCVCCLDSDEHCIWFGPLPTQPKGQEP